eukprot:TRINITY_DN9768_c0_g1_i1.p1 TRINITY_DN9768_c0_g1~~TRINITY_DN9768_c0_g1_i1.p1  ORF type:complete len:466 (-),score=39.99 TRINITY_DN9768_c0_g1_i1:51-1448(-)
MCRYCKLVLLLVLLFVARSHGLEIRTGYGHVIDSVNTPWINGDSEYMFLSGEQEIINLCNDSYETRNITSEVLYFSYGGCGCEDQVKQAQNIGINYLMVLSEHISGELSYYCKFTDTVKFEDEMIIFEADLEYIEMLFSDYSNQSLLFRFDSNSENTYQNILESETFLLFKIILLIIPVITVILLIYILIKKQFILGVVDGGVVGFSTLMIFSSILHIFIPMRNQLILNILVILVTVSTMGGTLMITLTWYVTITSKLQKKWIKVVKSVLRILIIILILVAATQLFLMILFHFVLFISSSISYGIVSIYYLVVMLFIVVFYFVVILKLQKVSKTKTNTKKKLLIPVLYIIYLIILSMVIVGSYNGSYFYQLYGTHIVLKISEITGIVNLSFTMPSKRSGIRSSTHTNTHPTLNSSPDSNSPGRGSKGIRRKGDRRNTEIAESMSSRSENMGAAKGSELSMDSYEE